MESFRSFQAAVASRSLIFAVAASLLLATFAHAKVPALALLVGTLVGLAYLFHIATGFNRLAKGGKRYLPFLTLESLLRVVLAGSVPFILLRHGPALGYITYLAGFVAPLAVAILAYQKQINVDCAQTRAEGKSANTTA